MSRNFKAITLLIVVLLQLTVLPHFTLFSVIPNYVLVFTIVMAIVGEDSESVVFSAVTGFAMDLLTGAPIGLNTLLYMYISIALVMITGTIYNKRIKVLVPMCFVASAVYEVLFGVFSSLLRGAGFYPEAIIKVVLPAAAMNTVIFIPVYLILSRLRFEKKRKGIKYERQV